MSKGEISWKGRFDDGRKRQAYAKKIGKDWHFFDREQRYDSWDEVEKPSLDDWLTLLDGVERRMQRDRIPEAEWARLKNKIQELYPEAEL